jgi:hypothetical protein
MEHKQGNDADGGNTLHLGLRLFPDDHGNFCFSIVHGR